MTIIKYSWRNIWRNRRRSIITIASVFFAVFFCVLMLSFSNGVWNHVIDQTLRTQSGHVQIHLKGYWKDQVTDNFMEMDPATIAAIENIGEVAYTSPRLETFALASTEKITKPCALAGIDPVRENRMSSLASHVVDGKYLTPNDDGILVGKTLSEYMHLSVGDTLALIGQGYHGANAAALFPVKGVVQLPIPEMDSRFIYASLPKAQEFISFPDGESGLLITLKNERKLDDAVNRIREKVDTSRYEILPWTVTMDKLLNQASSDKAFSHIIMFILYVIVGFGILSTFIMLANERRHEFALLVSLGMRRGRLVKSLLVELTAMTFLGVLAAVLVTVPIVLYFHYHPIALTGNLADTMLQYGMEGVLPMDSSPMVWISQICIIVVITCIMAIYPVRKILNLEIDKAIKQ